MAVSFLSPRRKFAPVGRPARYGAALFGALVLSGGLFGAATSADAAGRMPAQVDADYSIQHPLASGQFRFSSRVKGNRYDLQGSAAINALLGFYQWRSNTRAKGYVGRSASPRQYRLSYSSGSKQGSVKMSFPLKSASHVKSVPPDQPSRGRIPVKASDLRGVLDPLSSILAFTVPNSGKVAGVNPCKGRIPVFDGKQRFDLKLSSKGRASFQGSSVRGLSRTAYVCRVKYRPVGGYKMNRETQFMMNNDGIEIWLVPARSAGLFIPHKLVIPTVVGTAVVTNTSLRIRERGRDVAAYTR